MASSGRRKGIFLKDGKYQIYVPGRVGLKQRSTGTGDKIVARNIKRVVLELKDRQDWEILDALYFGKITLVEMYSEYASGGLDRIRGRLRGIVLSEHIDKWAMWICSLGGAAQTAATYRSQVETLVDDSLQLHELTAARISQWLTDIPKVTTGTRRKYLYALRSFITYLQERGLIQYDPSAAVKTPRKNKPRLVWQTEDVDRKIVDAAPEEYKALFALIKSTGAEVSPALAMLRNDIDLSAGLVHIKGTKNERRDRHDAIIEPWALPYLREHCRGLIGNVPLWPNLTRYRVHDVHEATCKALGIVDYTLRDARHSWAVRSRKRGESLEAIKEQLGHKSIYMAATIYAQFRPTIEERKGRKGAAS
jgi:integrase